MPEKYKEFATIILSLFFLFYGIFAVTFGYFLGKPGWFLWICYITAILIAIGGFRKNGYLIASQLSILTIPLLIWTVNFFYVLFNGGVLWGMPIEYFVGNSLILKLLSLQHLITIPLGFSLLYLVKIKRKDSWQLSFVVLITALALTLLFTNPALNINCAFRSCVDFIPSEGYVWKYSFLLLAFSFLVSRVIDRIKIFQK